MLGTESETDESVKPTILGRVSKLFARDECAGRSIVVAIADNGAASNFLTNHIVDDSEESLTAKSLGVIYENQVQQEKYNKEIESIEKNIKELNEELENITDKDSEAWAQLQAKNVEQQVMKCDKERKWKACVDEFQARYKKIDGFVGAKLNNAEDKNRKAAVRGSKI
jgi:Skp family chaperone for outer membrane proteins